MIMQQSVNLYSTDNERISLVSPKNEEIRVACLNYKESISGLFCGRLILCMTRKQDSVGFPEKKDELPIKNEDEIVLKIHSNNLDKKDELPGRFISGKVIMKTYLDDNNDSMNEINDDDLLISHVRGAPEVEQFLSTLKTPSILPGLQNYYHCYQLIIVASLYALHVVKRTELFSDINDEVKQNGISIVKKILDRHGIKYDTKALKEDSMPKIPSLLQYEETDYHFISRILRALGVFFFFTHDESGHTMVLSNSKDAYEKVETEVSYSQPLANDTNSNVVKSYFGKFSYSLLSSIKTLSHKVLPYADMYQNKDDTIKEIKEEQDNSKYMSKEVSVENLSYYLARSPDDVSTMEQYVKQKLAIEKFNSKSIIAKKGFAPDLFCGGLVTFKGDRFKNWEEKTLLAYSNVLRVSNAYYGGVSDGKDDAFIGRSQSVCFVDKESENYYRLIDSPDENDNLSYQNPLGYFYADVVDDKGKDKSEDNAPVMDTDKEHVYIKLFDVVTKAKITKNLISSIPRVGNKVYVFFSQSEILQTIPYVAYTIDERIDLKGDDATTKTIFSVPHDKEEEEAQDQYNRIIQQNKKDEQLCETHNPKDAKTFTKNQHITYVGYFDKDAEPDVPKADKSTDAKEAQRLVLHMKKGTKYTKIEEGDEKREYTKGDVEIILTEGKHDTELTQGDMIITIKDGKMDVKVKNDINFISEEGNITFNAQKGNIKIAADKGDISCDAGGDIKGSSKSDTAFEAKGNATYKGTQATLGGKSGATVGAPKIDLKRSA